MPLAAFGRTSTAATSLTEQLRPFPFFPWILFRNGCIKYLVQTICSAPTQVSDDQHQQAINVIIPGPSTPLACIILGVGPLDIRGPHSHSYIFCNTTFPLLHLLQHQLPTLKSSATPPSHSRSVHLPTAGSVHLLRAGSEYSSFPGLSNVCNIPCHATIRVKVLTCIAAPLSPPLCSTPAYQTEH